MLNAPDIEEVLESFKPSKYTESYVRLSQDRKIFLCEDFTKDMSSTLSALLLYYDNMDQDKEITIYINSSGGDAAALLNIIDVINLIRAPITTVNIGRCLSAGAILLSSGTKGRRKAYRHSEVMCHLLQCSFPILLNDQVDNDSYFNFLQQTDNAVIKIMAKNTGHTVAEIKKDFATDKWLDAKQALKYGLIDKII